MTTRDKVMGMLLGVGIGDAIGRDVEGWSCEEVRSTHDRITGYMPAGTSGVGTDDTLLTLAVAEGLLASEGKPDMNAQVQAHINAFNESTQGWGPTTFGAVRRLTTSVPWQLAGARGGKITGTGNGAIMKLAPTALLLVQNVPGAMKFICELVSMTHQTSVAIPAGLAHASGLAYCLQVKPAKFDAAEFVKVVIDASRLGRAYFPETLTEDITERLALCRGHADWPPGRCVTEFENGRNHVLHGLPFTFMFFFGSRDQSSRSTRSCRREAMQTRTGRFLPPCLVP